MLGNEVMQLGAALSAKDASGIQTTIPFGPDFRGLAVHVVLGRNLLRVPHAQ